MNRKWVDNEVYFGPDRRKRGLGKRWGDRRTFDDAAEPPPLGAVLRRLRVYLSDIATAEDHALAQEMAQFAVAEAERQQLPACAAHLNEVMALIGAGDFTAADARVMDAQTALNSLR
jgi:hypothetical protein